MKEIRKRYPNYSEEKLEEIEYGIEALYITFSKTIVITIFSLLLGVIKEVFFILIFYNIIRTAAFGMHAKTSFQCYVISGVFFIGAGLLCKYVEINFYVKLIVSIICFIHIIIFAPADTYKRPLVNKKKRKIYKFFSSAISLIYVLLIFFLKDIVLSNYLLFGLVDATVMIHPITYRMFQLPYNNYKSYDEVYS